MSNRIKSWKEMLDEAFADNGESWADVESNTMTLEEMEKVFDTDYGGTEGCEFTVWTKKSVYFPACYDGSEWIGRVSRHPDGKPTPHIGG